MPRFAANPERDIDNISTRLRSAALVGLRATVYFGTDRLETDGNKNVAYKKTAEQTLACQGTPQRQSHFLPGVTTLPCTSWGQLYLYPVLYAAWQYYSGMRDRMVTGVMTSKVVTTGKPSVGEPFVLVDCDGKVCKQSDFAGQWPWLYFGFTNCPDICPTTLNKMTNVFEKLSQLKDLKGEQFQPFFVSCDPIRDSGEMIKACPASLCCDPCLALSIMFLLEYISDFHPDFIGLTGSPQQIKDCCRAFRIYYSVPDVDDEQSKDYLIDHSIAIFLLDPKGRFVNYWGGRHTADEIVDATYGFVRWGTMFRCVVACCLTVIGLVFLCWSEPPAAGTTKETPTGPATEEPSTTYGSEGA
eukprot:gene10037-1810_t